MQVVLLEISTTGPVTALTSPTDNPNLNELYSDFANQYILELSTKTKKSPEELMFEIMGEMEHPDEEMVHKFAQWLEDNHEFQRVDLIVHSLG